MIHMKDVTAELLLLISYNAVFGQRNVARSKEMLGNLIVPQLFPDFSRRFPVEPFPVTTSTQGRRRTRISRHGWQADPGLRWRQNCGIGIRDASLCPIKHCASEPALGAHNSTPTTPSIASNY